MNKIFYFLGIIVGVVAIYWFIKFDANKLELFRIEIPKGTNIDTIEMGENGDIRIINIVVSKPLGKFKTMIAIVKKMNNGNELIYQIDNKRNVIRFSRDYIAIVSEYGKVNWGWFFIKDGKIVNRLPGIDKILDSIKRNSLNTAHLNQVNGNIQVSVGGKISKSINYGNLVTKYSELTFNDLPYALYKYHADSIVICSKNPQSMIKEKNGLFFIPPPGIGVLYKYNKHAIFNIIDSVSRLSTVPDKIHVIPDL